MREPCLKCGRIHTDDELAAMEPFTAHIHRPRVQVPGVPTWDEIKAGIARDNAARDSVKLAPRGKRPHCITCDRELRPYPRRRPSSPGQLYGTYGDNRFCGLTCGWRWAIHNTRNPIK